MNFFGFFTRDKTDLLAIFPEKQDVLYLQVSAESTVTYWRYLQNQDYQMRSVPFFNYPAVFTSKREELLQIFQDVGERGAFILQKDLEDFENALAEYAGAKYAVGMGNATDALLYTLLALEIGPGDEVIFCSHTMTATAAAIHFSRATPVPVECGSDHLIDPESVRAAITSKTKAIMPTQLNGRTCTMDPLMAIAEEHGLLIIEDSAQALGSKYKGKGAGTFGIAGAISFYPAKTLGCLGDAGAMLTSNDDFYERLMLLRNHGRKGTGEYLGWGLNSRMDNLQAAFLLHKLRSYDQEIVRRRELAGLYFEALSKLSELALPPTLDDPDHFDIFQNFELQADRRDELKAYLAEQGIGTMVQWSGKAVHQIEALGFDVNLTYTDRFFERCLMLPMNTSLSDEDISYVSEKIKDFYASH